MTENEIMKALEGLYKENINVTEFQILQVENVKTLCYIFKATLDLINRKNAEIYRLTEIEEAHREQNGELRKEVERLKKENDSQLEIIVNNDSISLGQMNWAIKEVIERVKKLGWYSYDANGTFLHIKEELLDKIAKEMGVEL